MGRVADVDLEALLTGGDRQPLIPELSDHVEGLARRLLERHPQRVRLDRALDLCAHVRRRLEESICRHQPVECLMWTLEVVVREEVLEPLLRVDRVREHRPPQEFVPQCFPEPLHLAQRLRMLRSAADVLDPHSLQRLLEFGLAPPHRVLPTVVRQHLRRLPVAGDTPFEGLHHQRRLLVVRQRVPDDKPAVVIHEHAHVQSLCASQPKREDVRLPKLIRRRPLEPPRWMLALDLRTRCLDQPLFVENPPHLVLGHTKCFEACQYIADSPRSPLLVFRLQLHHLGTLLLAPWHFLALLASALWLESRSTL